MLSALSCVAGVEAPALVERCAGKPSPLPENWSVAGVEAPALVERGNGLAIIR